MHRNHLAIAILLVVAAAPAAFAQLNNDFLRYIEDYKHIAVSEMDRLTQGNAAHAEETATASAQLNSQSEALRETVGQLTYLLHGRVEKGPTNPAESIAIATAQSGMSGDAGTHRGAPGTRSVTPRAPSVRR